MSLPRRLLIVVVTLVGVVAVTATTPPQQPSFAVSSAEKSITLVLDDAVPQARFLVDVASTVGGEGFVALRADIAVQDDGDLATDGVAVVDVGLLAPGAGLPVDVELAGDAALAAVREGGFGVERVVEGGQLVLAARRREGVERVSVTFVLVASTTVFRESAPGGDETLAVEVTPDLDFEGVGEGEGEGEGDGQ